MSLGRGKKTRAWESTRGQLKKRFESVGITSCEIRLPQCWGNYALSFAHAKKRRFLIGEEIEVVALSCAPCHTAIEGMPHNEMEKIVMRAINKRSRQP